MTLAEKHRIREAQIATVVEAMKFECPLDITAHYLKYPPAFVAYLKARGWFGYIDDYHKRLFGKYRTAQR